MNRASFIGIGMVLLFAIGLGFYLYSPLSASHAIRPTMQSSATSTDAIATSTPALVKAYTNSTYNFSLMMPADFSATESEASGQTTIVFQNSTGDGIQLIVSPWSEDTSGSYTLTAARIQQDLPDLEIADEQPVIIGPNYTGLAFKSDNPAFDGDSREVWFVFHGNLYQISTFARLDPLLQAIFATWQFN